MPLNDTALRNMKPSDKPFKQADGGGLFIQVETTGSRLWKISYRFDGKQKTISLGKYPHVSLKDARAKREEIKTMLAAGIDPSAQRQAEKESTSGANSMEAIAREWFAKFSPSWAKSHADTIIQRLERDVFPPLGTRPISDIKAPELLTVLRRIEERGALITAHRIKQVCGQVFRYAIATGRAERDPSADLRGALPPARGSHHASITDPAKIGELMLAIDGYKGSFVVRCALQFAPLVFVRQGELRHAEWPEIDFEKAEWRIPGPKMKMKDPHIIPLSRQAISILKELQPFTGDGRYLFPSNRTRERCMSENTTLAALRRMGYSKEDMTPHGFRSMASTLLNEQGWNRDAIERQLAHAERDSVRAAYNYAEHLPERRRMMQAWADHLDELRRGGK
ncbi:MAG: tyrosine-type recombinase/integrase [Magnetococcales bacterium]|nr:tyrosine-type recombinase/integrase [Magnetococcales bacterium]